MNYKCNGHSDTHARVHDGFYNAVFRNNLYDRILNSVLEVKARHTDYRIITSGHSLGAAASILTAVAFYTMSASLFHTGETFIYINFGCPQVGNKEWFSWSNSLSPNVKIWRYVNQHDIVPRLPLGFLHSGHTLQMDADDIKAYFLHYGNSSLGYAGVPFGWKTYSLIESPMGTLQHSLTQYMKYFNDTTQTKENYFVDKFMKVNNNTVLDDKVLKVFENEVRNVFLKT